MEQTGQSVYTALLPPRASVRQHSITESHQMCCVVTWFDIKWQNFQPKVHIFTLIK